MTTIIETKAQRRSITYIAVFVALFLGYLLLRGSAWQGSTELHTIMEVIATVLALTVGVMGLARFYSRKDNVFLFVGSGFLGTATLDGYHAVVTSTWFADRFPSPPASLIPWSWIASRVFLSISLWISWLAWRREDRLGESGKISEQTVYVAAAAFTLISFFFFALVPLPRAYYPEIIFHRPEEFVPAFFFLLALIGYLRKGHWKSDDFEHWMVLALIVGFMGQAMFMSFSGQLFDMMFDSAHLLKKVSYICVLTGLLISMYYLFRRAEESTEELAQQAAELRDSETYMRSVLDNVLEGIITINERGVIASFNLAAERIFGYTSTDMIGQHVKTLIPELMAELYLSEHITREVTAKRKDGTIFPLELGVSEMHLAGESRFISVVRDITERKRAEEEIQKRGRELEARTRELEASQRVTFAASERTSPDELLNLVVNLIRDQFDLYHAQVYLVDEEQDAAVLRESTGYAGRQLLQQKHHIPLDRPALVTKAIREGQPMLVTDVSQDPNFMPNPLLPDTQSELVVPLKVGEKVIGALDAQGRTAGRFSESTVALFQTMTDQVTFLFENSELVERITEQSQALTVFTNQLRTAADIARRLGTILDPERLLQQVVEMLQSRFGLYHAHIYVLDEAMGELTVQAGSGEVGRVLRERGHGISLDLEKSLVARAAREQGPVVVEDTTLESDFMPNPLLPQTRSEMAVPLVAGDRVLGVLDVQDDRPNRFTEADVDTYSTLAGQVATALENARLFEEQQRTEQALQESVARFTGFAEATDYGFGMADLEGNITFANPALCRMLGEESPETVLGKKIFMYYPPEQVEKIETTVLPTAMEKGQWVGELELLAADGRRTPTEENFFVIRDDQGAPRYLASIMTDITERKQAEEELLRLGMAVEQSIDGIAIPDLEGNIQFVNTAWAQMHGYSVEELLGKNLSIFHTEEQLQEDVIPFNERVMEVGGNQGEVGHVRKDGTTFPTWMSTTVLKDEEGNPVGLVGTARDITERKQAEETLRENEERLDLALEAADAGVWEFWPLADKAYFNDRWFTMLGYEPDELPLSYATWTSLLHPDDLGPTEQLLNQCVQKGKDFATEFRMKTKDGGWRWIHDIGKTVETNEDGVATRMLGTHTDVTQSKLVEMERERFTNQLRTAADLAEQINAILDPDQLLSEVVTQLQDRFDLYHVHIYLLDEETHDLNIRAGSGKVGQTMLKHGHSIPLDREQSLVARAARARKIVSVADTSHEPDFMANPLLPDTRSEVAVPLAAGDKVLGVLDVQDDQPRRFTPGDLSVFSTLAGQIAIALENAAFVEEVQQTAEQLREVDRLKSEFMSSMSHELRTPLNSILGYTEVMLMGIDGALPSETMEDIQAIHENGQHLLNLINDILDLAKIEAGTMTLNLEAVEIAPLLEGVKTNNAGLLLNKPIKMVVKAAKGLPTIQADEVRLNQVLNNLVGNAVKFTDKGTITLNAFRDDSWLCIDVTDTGIGISDEDMKKIFDRFTQADSSNARRVQGTGLGLAITLHLVQMHGGTIDVQSKPGKGSTFTVRLPIDSD